MQGIRFRTVILPVALPIFLGAVVFQIQTVANRVFLGQVDAGWLAVIANVLFPIWTMMAMLNSLSSGATILISHALGAGDKERARTLAALAIVGNSVVAFLCFLFWATSSRLVYQAMGVHGKILDDCVAYTSIASLSFLGAGVSGALTSMFQAGTQTKPLMISGVVRSLLNVALDAVLIFGLFGLPAMGLLGAATATVLADLVGLAVILLLFFRKRDLDAKPTLATWKALDPRQYKSIVKMGFPTSLEDLLWNAGNLVLIAFMNALDPLATAVYSIVFTVELLAIIAFVSLSQATMALVGRAKGAGELFKVRGLALTSQMAAWGVSIFVAVLYLLIPNLLVGVFTSDPAMIARTSPILLISTLMLFPKAMNFMLGAGIRGLGDTKWMMGTQIFGTVFIVALGYLLIFVFGWGVAGLFIAMCIDEGVRAILNGLHFRRATSPTSRMSRKEQESRSPQSLTSSTEPAL